MDLNSSISGSKDRPDISFGIRSRLEIQDFPFITPIFIVSVIFNSFEISNPTQGWAEQKPTFTVTDVDYEPG